MTRGVLALLLIVTLLVVSAHAAVLTENDASTSEPHMAASYEHLGYDDYGDVSGIASSASSSSQVTASVRVGSVLRQADGTWRVIGTIDMSNSVAYGVYNNTNLQVGWGVLRMQVSAATDASDADKAYALGLLESYLTWDLMFYYTQNYMLNEFGAMLPNAPAGYWDWFSQQQQFIQSQIASRQNNPPELVRYWQAQYLLDQQFSGMVAGYNAFRQAPAEPLSRLQLYLLQSAGDLYELNDKFNVTKGPVHHLSMRPGLTECSAIVQFCPGQDLYAAHVTWRPWYSGGLRIWKLVTYRYTSIPNVPSPFTVATSSSPTFLSSKDDFFITGNRLTVMETTNSVFNKSLLDLIMPQSALCWQRAVVSNLISATGDEWTTNFARFNSGTYNNFWHVIDGKNFNKQSTTLPPGTLWAVEQLPGQTQRGDLTAQINANGYFATYNVPYFKEIYDASGYEDMFKKKGDEYSFDKCPRANIFRRYALGSSGTAKYSNCAADTSNVKQIIQWNDFQHDPLSMGDPMNAIASRGDFLSGAQGKPVAFGGTDGKISAASRVDFLAADAIVGPTHESLPPFRWSDHPEFAGVHHAGAPDLFNFDWMTISSKFPAAEVDE